MPCYPTHWTNACALIRDGKTGPGKIPGNNLGDIVTAGMLPCSICNVRPSRSASRTFIPILTNPKSGNWMTTIVFKNSSNTPVNIRK